MPKSKVRKKPAYTPPADRLPSAKARAAAKEPSPSWWAPVMVLLMIAGLIYIVIFYARGDKINFMIHLGVWNYVVGFAAIIVGLLMGMRWR